MGVVIQSEVWELQPWPYFFIFFSCFASVLLLPYFVNNSSRKALFDLGGNSVSAIPAPYLRFQRSFLIVYSLVSVIEGLQSLYGEFEYGHYGLTREQMVLALSLGSAASLLTGTFLGVLFDVIGRKKACTLFCIIHLAAGVLKIVTKHSSIWMSSICLALASSILSFSFETWVVAEHEKLGYRQDFLSDTFWLMTFSESASLIGSQALANSLITMDVAYGIVFPNAAASFLAVIGIVCIKKGWNESAPSSISSYKEAFSAHILSDKRVWLLAWAQACLHFSVATFWLLWAPTIVADGREVHVEMIFPCLMGSRMLGSTAVPWLLNGPLSIHAEDCLKVAFIFASFALCIVAYDYQEISVVVALFCLFHACVGLILPSLAKLRSLYVPNELRAGMISLSLAPANATILYVLIWGGYYRELGNATILAISAFGLLTAACCAHFLKQWRWQPHQGRHDLPVLHQQ